MAPKRKPRKKYNSDDSRRRLVRAATNVFSKFGYDAATTRNIAAQAKVHESLINRYFKNKVGLFFATLKQYYQNLTEDLPYPECDTLEEELSHFVRFRMEYYRREKKFVRILITRTILDPVVRKEMGGLARNGVPGLVVRLEKLRREGKIEPKIDLADLSLLVAGMAFSMTMFTEIISTLDRKKADATLALGVKLLSERLTT